MEVAADIQVIFNALDRSTVKAILQAAIRKFAKSAPGLSARMEDNLVEGFTVFDFPLEQRLSIRAEINLGRVKQKIHGWTKVVGMYPTEAAYLRLISVILMGIREEWQISMHSCTGKSFNYQVTMDAFVR